MLSTRVTAIIKQLIELILKQIHYRQIIKQKSKSNIQSLNQYV